MKRRFVPFGFAAVVMLVCLSPLVLTVDQITADRYTLLIASMIFAVKTVLFFWMRRRMVTDTRDLTIFGTAIVDFFTGLTVLAVVWCAVYGYLFWLATEERLISQTGRTLNRAAIITGGALIVGTGIAVAYEMRRAGSRLAVHEDPPAWDGTTERRVGPRDRRQPPAAMA